MKKEQLFILLFLFYIKLSAQTESDTSIFIPSVEITDLKASHSPGLVLNHIDSATKLFYEFSSIAELLSIKTNINVRNYGNGLLATINSRGLGANHTAILWNGIPLNSINLGLTDLSLLPTSLFDEVTVASGGTGTNYGNNAMGTAIELQNTHDTITYLKLSTIIGSYGTQATNLKFNYSNNSFSATTVIHNLYSKNDFEYINVAKIDQPLERQRNSSQYQTAILQNFNLNFKNTIIKSGIWYQFSNRWIPPLMFTTINREVQKDSSVRVFTYLEHRLKTVTVSSNLSFSKEKINYNNYINGVKGSSEVRTYRNELIFKYNPTRKVIIYSSIAGNISFADIPEYKQTKRLDNVGVNVNAKYFISDKWTAGTGIKKEFTNLIDSPFSYSAGLEGNLIQNILILKASVSKIYTLPTLNDLYWTPGGNINLKPENGITSQVNFQYKYLNNHYFSITTFYSMINDWIQWIPNSSVLYSPVNVKQVESSGIEASIKQLYSLNQFRITLSGNYSLSRTINKTFTGNNDLENKQLIFVPIHYANAFLLINYKNIGVYSAGEFTGLRYTTADNSSYSDPYFLVHSGFSFNYNYDRFQIMIRSEIKNIFNVNYQPIPWRAMPGRSYFLTLNLNLNLNNQK